MTNEEQTVDQTVEDVETNEETSNEEVETSDEQDLSVEEMQKELKTLKAQKEHWRKKATSPKEVSKENNTQEGLTREEAILFAKGLSEEDVELAAKIAKVNGVSLIKATEDDYFQSKLEAKKAEERSKKASLGASSGSNVQPEKPVKEMTRDEHKDYFKKVSES